MEFRGDAPEILEFGHSNRLEMPFPAKNMIPIDRGEEILSKIYTHRSGLSLSFDL
jgi:hypothetical protein